MIQEIFGIDEYVRADVDRWAKRGYEAIAQSMFDRTNPGLDLAQTRRHGQAFGAVRQAKPEYAIADIAACVAYLKPRGPVFIVGYCYGGAMVWQAAGRLEGIAAGPATTAAAWPGRRT